MRKFVATVVLLTVAATSAFACLEGIQGCEPVVIIFDNYGPYGGPGTYQCDVREDDSIIYSTCVPVYLC